MAKTRIGVGQQAEVLSGLIAYSYASPNSVDLRRAIDRLTASLPEVGFIGEVAMLADDEPLRQQLRDSLQNTQQGPQVWVWWVPREAFPLTVTSIQVAGQGKHAPYPMYGGDWRVGFWFTVSHVMQVAIHLLARCRPGHEDRRPAARSRAN